MMPNRLSCGVIVASMVVAVFARAALAEPDPIDGVPKNGLSSQAFRRNALTTNRKALQILLTHPLNSDLFDVEGGYIGRQLLDPKASAVMKEMVACALGRSTELRHVHRNGNVERWRGELGFCRRWENAPPDEACQERVTACLMARVNADGKSIPLLLLGAPPLHPPRDRVFTETSFRESPPDEDPSEGWPIAGFSGPGCARDRDCNWAPGYVGKCDGGEIRMAIKNPSVCRSTTVRICAGIHGCLEPGSASFVPADFQRPAYSKHLQDKQGACVDSPIRFRCPTEIPIGGYYSVMTWPRPKAGVQPTVVKVDGSGVYPASEMEVFTYREGGFYGNLFKRDHLTRSCEVNDEMTRLSCTDIDGDKQRECNAGLGDNDCSSTNEPLPSTNIFACYSFAQQEQAADDDLGVAAFNYRMCSSPDPTATCFRFRPQRCHFKDPAANQAKGSHCVLAEDGTMRECVSQLDDKTRFNWVITTRLNDPCNLIKDEAQCTAMRRSIVREARKRGCGGCSATTPGGMLQSVSITALVVLLLYRRRRRGGRPEVGSRRLRGAGAGR